MLLGPEEMRTDRVDRKPSKKFHWSWKDSRCIPSKTWDISKHFKTDFIKQVQLQIHNQEAAAYTSKSCLTETPYDLVKNVDDDLDEIWKQLDDRYGRTSKLTESIMYDIKRAKPMKEEDGQRFV